jgi:hypothetical protein
LLLGVSAVRVIFFGQLFDGVGDAEGTHIQLGGKTFIFSGETLHPNLQFATGRSIGRFFMLGRLDDRIGALSSKSDH